VIGIRNQELGIGCMHSNLITNTPITNSLQLPSYICLMITDLRSDTFTKPSPAMLEAMFKAPVGDDVFGEDPSVNKLEDMSAAMFGMDAALFCPSGTMTNQIAIKCHTQPGDEVICDKVSHVYIYEGSVLSRLKDLLTLMTFIRQEQDW